MKKALVKPVVALDNKGVVLYENRSQCGIGGGESIMLCPPCSV